MGQVCLCAIHSIRGYRRLPRALVALTAALVIVAVDVAPALASSPPFVQVSGSPFSTGSGSNPYTVAFSPSGSLLAVANYVASGTVSVFSVDSATGALSQVAGSPFSAGADTMSVTFSPSGNLLAATNNDGSSSSVSMFSVDQTTGALTQVNGSPFPTGTEAPYSVAFSPSGNLLATANYMGTVSVFSVSSTGILSQVSGSPFSVGSGVGPYSVAFSPSGNLLATAI